VSGISEEAQNIDPEVVGSKKRPKKLHQQHASARSEIVFHHRSHLDFAELFPKRHPARDTLSKTTIPLRASIQKFVGHWGNS
jgi:CMP-N-acetylneuraminic acid synthetase